MFSDKIEIASPGGLPKGMHEDEYYRGGISIPGNRIIATIFLRLQMIERFGTGIKRIMEATGFGKTKVVQILNHLDSEGYIHKIGNGRGTKYTAD